MQNDPAFMIAIGIMIALITLSSAIRFRIKKTTITQTEFQKDIDARIDKLESKFNSLTTRFENLETIVIEHEKERKFTDA